MNDYEMIHKSLSCLHASADTIEEVMKMAENERKPRHTERRIAAIAFAAALAFALTLTASAYHKSDIATDIHKGIDFEKFVDVAFGTGVKGHKAYETKVTSPDGTETVYFPNFERVEADTELAEGLIKPYLNEINKEIKFNGYDLKLYNYAMDENGFGVLCFELENPDGIGFSEMMGKTAEDGVMQLRIELLTKEGKRYDIHFWAENASFSDTHALYVAYFTPFEPVDGNPLTLKIVWDGEESGEYDVTLACNKLIPSKNFTTESADFKISPIGMLTDADISRFKERIVLCYTDGTEYVVADDYICNYCGSIVEKDGAPVGVAYAFNRLVPVEMIDSVVYEFNSSSEK